MVNSLSFDPETECLRFDFVCQTVAEWGFFHGEAAESFNHLNDFSNYSKSGPNMH